MKGAISNSGWLLLLGLVSVCGLAATPAEFADRAEKNFLAARSQLHREPTNAVVVWHFGRACFELGEFATNDIDRATLAVQGISAMRALVARDPRLAAGHFYLAMNLGQLARTKMLGALPLVDEMEVEFKAAAALDEHFENAGPDRNLGELYLQAPGWPTSIGSRSKARKFLERAAEIAPDFPENRLNLLEAALRWDDKKLVLREFDAVEKIWPDALKTFTGDEWEADWVSWQKRRAALKRQAERLLKIR